MPEHPNPIAETRKSWPSFRYCILSFLDFGAPIRRFVFYDRSFAAILRAGQWACWSQGRKRDVRECRVVAGSAERLDCRHGRRNGDAANGPANSASPLGLGRTLFG